MRRHDDAAHALRARAGVRRPGRRAVPYGKWREYEPADTVRFYAAASLRRWVDQVHASEDPRARHRLAILQRIQEGAEGMIGRYDTRPHASAIAAAVRGLGDRVVRRSSWRRSI